jgi:hypothetical protein
MPDLPSGTVTFLFTDIEGARVVGNTGLDSRCACSTGGDCAYGTLCLVAARAGAPEHRFACGSVRIEKTIAGNSVPIRHRCESQSLRSPRCRSGDETHPAAVVGRRVSLNADTPV